MKCVYMKSHVLPMHAPKRQMDGTLSRSGYVKSDDSKRVDAHATVPVSRRCSYGEYTKERCRWPPRRCENRDFPAEHSIIRFLDARFSKRSKQMGGRQREDEKLASFHLL